MNEKKFYEKLQSQNTHNISNCPQILCAWRQLRWRTAHYRLLMLLLLHHLSPMGLHADDVPWTRFHAKPMLSLQPPHCLAPRRRSRSQLPCVACAWKAVCLPLYAAVWHSLYRRAGTDVPTERVWCWRADYQQKRWLFRLQDLVPS